MSVGEIALEIYRQAVLWSYIKNVKFLDSIVAMRAMDLPRDCTHVLWPMLKPDKGGTLHFGAEVVDSDSVSRDMWEVHPRTMKEIFSKALRMHAELQLNQDKYEYLWFPPNKAYDPSEMSIEGGDDGQLDGYTDKVWVTLFPGIAAQYSEASEDKSAEGSRQSRRIVAKAKVMLQKSRVKA